MNILSRLAAFVAVVLLGLSTQGHAGENLTGKNASEPKIENIERVGGDYFIKSIDGNDSGFVTTFAAVNPTGRFDTIRLESRHIHVAVKVGQRLRISAEVVGGTVRDAEASQVLVFIPSRNGETPVWLLSHRHPSLDLKGARYLEMHAPETDFTVL